MKTAISIPDRIFREAERLAKRLGMSRSELYARAVDRFVAEQRGDWITEQLNELCREVDTGLDPVLAQMQYLSLPPEEW